MNSFAESWGLLVKGFQVAISTVRNTAKKLKLYETWQDSEDQEKKSVQKWLNQQFRTHRSNELLKILADTGVVVQSSAIQYCLYSNIQPVRVVRI